MAVTLKNILKQRYLKEDLECYAQKLYLRGTWDLRKDELAEKIANQLLLTNVMMQRLGVLTNQQITLFERAIDTAFRPSKTELRIAQQLDELDYAIITKEGLLVVADDVKVVYKRISTRAFHEKRKKIAWLRKCLYFCENFHAIAPVDIIHKAYRRKPQYKISKKEFLILFNQIPDDLKHSVVFSDEIFYIPFTQKGMWQKLQKLQADVVEYYIPPHRMVEYFWKHGNLANEQVYQRINIFFQTNGDVSDDKAESITCEIWKYMHFDGELGKIMEQTEIKNIRLENKLAAQQLKHLLREAKRHTRTLSRKGFTELELEGAKQL